MQIIANQTIQISQPGKTFQNKTLHSLDTLGVNRHRAFRINPPSHSPPPSARDTFHRSTVQVSQNCFPIPMGPAPQYIPVPYTPPSQMGPRQVKIGLIGNLMTGGVVGGITHQRFAEALTAFKTGGAMTGLKSLGQASLKAGAIGAGINAALSTVQNLQAISQGKITGRDAVANITSDTVGGLLLGSGAGIGAGAANLALGAIGVAGLPLTIGASVAGAVGGVAANQLYSLSGLKNRFFEATRSFFG